MDIEKITIILTNRCNLNCSFCYRIKSNDSVSMEIINKIIQIVKAQINLKKICFYGGEPLLEISILEYLLSSVYEINPNIKYVLYTNGLLLDNNFITRNIKYKIHYIFNGNAIIHSLNRIENTFFIKNIKKFNISYNLNLVVTEENIDSLLTNINELLTNNYRKINISHELLCNKSWSDTKKIKIFDVVHKLFELNNRIFENEGSFPILNLLNIIDENIEFNCSLFKKKSISISTSGIISYCLPLLFLDKKELPILKNPTISEFNWQDSLEFTSDIIKKEIKNYFYFNKKQFGACPLQLMNDYKKNEHIVFWNRAIKQMRKNNRKYLYSYYLLNTIQKSRDDT